METLKKVVARVGVGLALGFGLGMLLGPWLVNAWVRPITGNAVALACNADVEIATRLLVRLQLFLGVAGAVLVPLLVLVVGRRFSKTPPVAADPNPAG